jgi:predicted nucleic acid-binding protein
MRLVLDASAAIRVLMRAESASQLLDHISAAAVVAAPSLYGSEVANALWKYVKAGSLELEAALERYEEAIALIDDSLWLPRSSVGASGDAPASRTPLTRACAAQTSVW